MYLLYKGKEAALGGFGFGDKHEIQARWKEIFMPSIGFAQQPFYSIALDGLSNLLGDGDSEAGGGFGWQGEDQKVLGLVFQAAALGFDKIGAATDPLFFREGLVAALGGHLYLSGFSLWRSLARGECAPWRGDGIRCCGRIWSSYEGGTRGYVFF